MTSLLGKNIVEHYKLPDASSMVAQALDFARDMHVGQKYGDNDYFAAHIVPVVVECSKLVDTENSTVLLCAAALHDVLEDTCAIKEELEHYFGSTVADLVADYLTRNKLGYVKYVNNITGSKNASIVKYADSLCNYRACAGDTAREALQVRYKKTLELLIATWNLPDIFKQENTL